MAEEIISDVIGNVDRLTVDGRPPIERCNINGIMRAAVDKADNRS